MRAALLPERVSEFGAASGATAPTTDFEAGATPLVSGQDYIDITFISVKANSAWSFDSFDIEYPNDPPPEKIDISGTIKSSTGARVYLSTAPSDGNYTARWSIR